MKTTLKVSGVIELTKDDLFDIFQTYANRDKGKMLTPMIMEYIREEYKYNVKTVQYPKDDLSKIAVIIDGTVDEGATPIGKPVTTSVEKASNEGFTRKWRGLYDAIGETLETLRKRKKSFVSWDDLMAELHDFEDQKGKKMFVQGGEKLPIGIVKHRLAPSQVVRQAQNQPNLRGVQIDKKNGGVKF